MGSGLPSVRARFTYGDTAGRFLAVDESISTPASPCFTGTDGGAVDDPCTTDASDLRAVGLGLLVGPLGGPATEDQVVPPSGSKAGGVFLAQAAGSEISFYSQVWGMGEITALELYRARRGWNGPLIHTFVNLPISGDSGRSETIQGVSQDVLDALFDGDLYINVESSAFPFGEIRGQLNSAALIFEDGFESGNTSAWVP